MGSEESKPLRTIDIIPRKGEMIKPRELIGLEEMNGWTLYEMRVFDLLLSNAWDKQLEDPSAEFTIKLAELRGLHDSNDRIKPALETLQRSLVRVKLPNGMTRSVQYLGATDMEDEERPLGTLTYDFHKKLVEIVRKSDIYARMEQKVQAAFTSKYAYALYEHVAARIEMRKQSTELSITALRGWLGVEASKLQKWGNLNDNAIKIAVREVNALSPYHVEITPQKKGRKIDSVVVSWSKKKPYSHEEQTAAVEVNRVKTGRRARMNGTVEHITNVPQLSEHDIQKGYDAAAKICRIDKQAAYRDWQQLVATFTVPLENPTGHFIAFCKKRAEDVA